MNKHTVSHSSHTSIENRLLSELATQVEAFLNSANMSLAPKSRILDICSEVGEVFDSLSGTSDLSEEVGDLLYSSLALCCELSIKDFVVHSNKGIGLVDLTMCLGRLAKEELKATNYGKDEKAISLDGLRETSAVFAVKVIQFAMDNGLDPSSILSRVLFKYESRIKRTESPGSGS